MQRVQQSAKKLLQSTSTRFYSSEVSQIHRVFVKSRKGFNDLAGLKRQVQSYEGTLGINRATIFGCIVNFASETEAQKLLEKKTITLDDRFFEVSWLKGYEPSVILRVRGTEPVSDAAQVREAFESFGPIEGVARSLTPKSIELDEIVFDAEPPFFVTFKNQEDATKAHDSLVALPNGIQLVTGYIELMPPTALIKVVVPIDRGIALSDALEGVVKTILESAVVPDQDRPSLSYSRFRSVHGAAAIWMQFPSIEAATKVMDAPKIHVPSVKKFSMGYAARPVEPKPKETTIEKPKEVKS
ncbi:hypothetical protein C8J56DRAFT_329054 [Mycena floridula]|nr:hypothetical protein C8J56DRAFT_329054 [Mycena floridula]